MTVEECIEAYLGLSERVFYTDWSSFNWMKWIDWQFNVRPRFSSSKLEQAIKEIIIEYDENETGDGNSELRIENDPACKVWVSNAFLC